MDGEFGSSSQSGNANVSSTGSLTSSSATPTVAAAAAPPTSTVGVSSTIGAGTATVGSAPQNPNVGGQQQHHQQQTPNVSSGQQMLHNMGPTQPNFSAGQPRPGMTPIRGRQQTSPYSQFPSMSASGAMQQQRGGISMQGMGGVSRPPALGTPSYVQMSRGGMGGQPLATSSSSMIPPGQTDQSSSMQSPFSTPQARQKQGSILASGQTLPGIQSMSTVGSSPLSSQVRSSGTFGHPQQRPGQGPLRSQSSSQQQSLNPQKMHMSHFPRPQSGTLGSQIPGMSQAGSSVASGTIPHQQWMPSSGKQMHQPSLPSSPFPSQLKQQNAQQRPYVQTQQQSHTLTPQQQQMQEQQSQQFQQQRMPQSVHGSSQQQQMSRTAGLTPQKTSVPSGPPSTVPPTSGNGAPAGNTDQPTETSNKILEKRSIQDLLAQIDPHEKLDPEVEDIMIEIAEDFLDKQSVNENHKQRLAVIRKSVATSQTGTETGNTKGSAGQATGNASAKGPATKGLQEAPATD